MFARKSTEKEQILPLKNVISCTVEEERTITIKHKSNGLASTLNCKALDSKSALEIEGKINYAIVTLDESVDDE